MKKFIEGPFGVLLTPFNGSKVDEKTFVKQIERINDSKISGYVVNGSTSEFVQLSLEEQKKIAKLTAEYSASDKKIVVSSCTGNISDTYELCKNAADIGAFAVLICPPYYFKYTVKERKDYFTKIADISPVPVILYNIPFFTQELELDVIYRLFEHKNIIGIKDSSANMKRLEHMVEVTKESKVSILTGTDDILLPALCGGCAGSMTALAAIMPEKICAIYDAVKKGDLKKAMECQFEILPTTRKADSLTFPVGYKKLMEEVSGLKFADKEVEL